MSHLPEETVCELRKMIEEGMPVDQIAFMLRISEERVREEMRRLNVTPQSK